MSAFQQNVTDAIEEGVAEIAERQYALGSKVDARANRIEDEVQNLANEIHNKVVEPHFHIYFISIFRNQETNLGNLIIENFQCSHFLHNVYSSSSYSS